jgi:hypothetical protein
MASTATLDTVLPHYRSQSYQTLKRIAGIVKLKNILYSYHQIYGSGNRMGF